MVVSGESSDISRSETTTYWGWFLVGMGSIMLPGFLFTAFISKLLPPSNYPLIAAIQKDRILCRIVALFVIISLFRIASLFNVIGLSASHYKHFGCLYYCYLVPLTLPVSVVAVYFHWLSMKMFKHA